MTNGPIEPSADIRAAAHSAREIYLALIYEEFTEQEALVIVCKILTASIGNGGDS